jgi:magnesium-transporting ATPase (P-type)
VRSDLERAPDRDRHSKASHALERIGSVNLHQDMPKHDARIGSTLPDARTPLPAPYRVGAAAVISALHSDSTQGLTRTEAGRRLALYGPNRLKSAPETPWWRRLLEQFENVLVIILLGAIVISTIEWALQDPRETALPYEAIVITLIVVLNAMLGYFQEARAERSVRALMALAAPESTVIRDGER